MIRHQQPRRGSRRRRRGRVLEDVAIVRVIHVVVYIDGNGVVNVGNVVVKIVFGGCLEVLAADGRVRYDVDGFDGSDGALDFAASAAATSAARDAA